MKTSLSFLKALTSTSAIAALLLGVAANRSVAQEGGVPSQLTDSSATVTNPPINVDQLASPPSQDLPFAPDVPTMEPSSLSQIRQYGKEGKSKTQAQVTSVSQLSDVQPTDWAFQALQSLVERYGCIAGYPNRTYRGNRPMTRYEFAAGLNACMDRVNELIAAATADKVTKEDLAAIKKLQDEFAAELATLRGRVDSLEAKTKTLEAQQFSTTTKLSGQVLFSLVKFGGDFPNVTPKLKIDDKVTFNSRATLSLLTSFSGKDLLITSLQGNNFGNLRFTSTRTRTSVPNALNLGPIVTSATPFADANDVHIFYLGYRFPFHKEKGTIYITAAGGELSDFTNALNPYFEDEGSGALSAFGLRNPIYRQINSFGGVNFSGVGAGVNYRFNNKVDLGVGYLVPGRNASDPTENLISTGGGLFGGDYAAIAQLTLKPTEKLGLGLTYVRSYSKTPGVNIGFNGFIGTGRSVAPFDILATSADSAGFQFNWAALPKFAVGGWVGATFASGENPAISNQSATILNYALTLAFPDLGRKGNLGGLILGSQPQVISNSNRFIGTDRDMNFHIEGFYRVKINNFISITPGGFVVINPSGSSNNDPIYATTVRTTFSF